MPFCLAGSVEFVWPDGFPLPNPQCQISKQAAFEHTFQHPFVKEQIDISRHQQIFHIFQSLLNNNKNVKTVLIVLINST